VTDITVQEHVKRSIGQTRAKILQRPAEEERAEASKMKDIKMAEAESEKSALRGQGTARARDVINRMYWENFERMRTLDASMTQHNTEAMMGALRQLDSMLEINRSESGQQVTYLPHDPQTVADLMSAICNGYFILPGQDVATMEVSESPERTRIIEKRG
jgi:regulator of protease activity HflC (stomatin/prohibitin superfamily)